MKFVGSSRKSKSGFRSKILAKAIFVLCHQLTSEIFFCNNSSIQIHPATLWISAS
jgi:hypothetical protein